MKCSYYGSLSRARVEKSKNFCAIMLQFHEEAREERKREEAEKERQREMARRSMERRKKKMEKLKQCQDIAKDCNHEKRNNGSDAGRARRTGKSG